MNQILRRQTSRSHYGSKVMLYSDCFMNVDNTWIKICMYNVTICLRIKIPPSLSTLFWVYFKRYLYNDMSQNKHMCTMQWVKMWIEHFQVLRIQCRIKTKYYIDIKLSLFYTNISNQSWRNNWYSKINHVHRIKRMTNDR